MNRLNEEDQQLDSLRILAKGKIAALVKASFNKEFAEMIPDVNKRSELYLEASLVIKNPDAFNDKVIAFVYQNASTEMLKYYNKAKEWASSIFKDYNYLFSPIVILRSFRGKEDLLLSEHTESYFIIVKIDEAGFDIGDAKKGFSETNDEVILPESHLNDNFSEPLAEKTSQVYPGYDVLADILPSDKPEGHENIMQGFKSPTLVGLYFFLK